jgi:hypothetical protein
MTIRTAQISFRLIGLAGAAAFATFFMLTFSVPAWVETFGASFIEGEVNERIDSSIDALEPPAGEGALSRVANALYQQNQQEIARLKAALKANAHERMADALAQIRDLDCVCRDKVAQFLADQFQLDIVLLQAANDRITDFIQATYMEIAAELKRDIRVFTGVNTTVFLLLLFVSFLKPRAAAHLFLPGVLLFVSTAVCSYFYVFEQNWLLTIIYSDYLGFGYLAYLAIVFLFLCDIFFNKGRVTTNIVNAFLDMIGSAANVSLC